MSNSNPPDAEIFAAALRLPPGERSAYLLHACGGDAALRGRVEELLKAQGRIGDFLEGAGPVAGMGDALGAGAGERVGRYRLIEKLGEGGCGVVYLAEQDEPIRRQVALKIIKPGMDTRAVIARFEAERQALALMDHPGIAKMFDAGETESGRPYFVMELIRGTRITEYCDQQALPTTQRLRLFIQVCQAIQHAHQKGIIHRDIKPSNILVTTTAEGAAQPVVIDFGIAKATIDTRLTDKTLFTAVDMLIGTPTYMSPEQAAVASADVDTRTDVYSLGVLLYELMTGTTPFNAGELLQLGIDEVRRAIREQEPPRPSVRLSRMTGGTLTGVAKFRRAEPHTLIRTLRGDLDWIAMKALEKDRARRYESASGLAADVDRFLSDDVVMARPAGTWYRLRKSIVRHKAAVTAVAAFIVILAAGTVTIALLLRQERRARADAETARRLAEANQARAATESVRSKQASKFVQEVILGGSPYFARGQDTTVLRKIIDNAALRIPKDLVGQPEVQAELQLRIGKVYGDLQLYEKGEEQYRAALAILAPNLAAHREASAHILYELALIMMAQRRYPEAQEVMQQSVKLRREEYGPEHAKVADSMNQLARTLYLQDQGTEATAMFQEALAMRRRLLPAGHNDITDSLSDLAVIYGSDESTLAEAEKVHREILERWRKHYGHHGRNVDVGLVRLSRTLLAAGRAAFAEDITREAVTVVRETKGSDSIDITTFLLQQAVTFMALGKFADMRATVDEIIAFEPRLQNNKRLNDQPLLGRCLLSQIEEIEGNLEASERLARAALTESKRLQGASVQNNAVPMMLLSSALAAAGKHAEAEREFAELLPPGAEEKPASFFLLMARAKYYARLGQWDQARADVERARGFRLGQLDAHITNAAIQLGAGRIDAFRQATDAMFLQYRATQTPVVASRTALLCLLIPQPADRLKEMSQLVAVGTGGEMGPYYVARAQLARALFELRTGQFRSAIDSAQQASATAPRIDVRIMSSAISAMALAKLGQANEAGGALARSRELASQLPKIGSDLGGEWKETYEPDFGISWPAWVYTQALLREASEAVEASTPRAAAASIE